MFASSVVGLSLENCTQHERFMCQSNVGEKVDRDGHDQGRQCNKQQTDNPSDILHHPVTQSRWNPKKNKDIPRLPQ